MGVVALTGLKKFCELGIALYICDTELRMLKQESYEFQARVDA